MLENVRNGVNNNFSSGDEMRIKSHGFTHRPAFKANPNAVDNYPPQDAYAPQNGMPQEEPVGIIGKLKYIIPTWLGLHFGTEGFNKINGGEYEKSLVGRLGKFGDRLAGTKLVKNSFVDKMVTYGRTVKQSVKNFLVKHDITRAMYKTPTAPESSLVTNFLETQNEADLKEAVGKLGEFLEKGPKSLSQTGATKAEIDALKSKFGTNMVGKIKHEAAAVQEYLLGKLGADLGHTDILGRVSRREAAIAQKIQKWTQALADPTLTPPAKQYIKDRIASMTNLKATYRADTLKRLKMQAAGLKKGALDAIKKDPAANAAQLEKALEAGKKYSPKLAQYFNKIKSITQPMTKLGKFFPKMAKLGMRGLTFGGGLFNTLFVAFFLGDAVKNTIDAPKEQKTGTAVHGLMDAMSWVIAMPIALKGMHAVNGIKNLGKTEAQVGAFKKALNAFNKQVKEGAFKDLASYTTELNKVKALKSAGVAPKGFKKLLTKAASFLSIGLEQIEPFKASTSGLTGSAKWTAKMGNLKAAMPNFLRNCIGYPLRFALYMFVFQPIVDKVFSSVISAIFGKPYDPEKEKEEAAKQAAMHASLYPGPAIIANPNAADGLDNVDVNSLSDNNLIKQELIRRGLVKPSSPNNPNNPDNTTYNGVNVTTVTNQPPFMPPQYNQNGANGTNGTNGTQPGNVNVNNGQKDPNVSEYDTLPLTYQPTLDPNNLIPYGDPQTVAAAKRRAELLESGMQVTNDIDKFIKK